MQLLDWIVLSTTITLIVVYGIWKTVGSKDLESYLLADKKARWWTIGLSVMATQASAITFLSTPGQAYMDGMGFAQFYFALPIAMIIICIVFIPIFYRLKVYTAYEFLEQRFDLKTRSLTAILFLVQRGMAAGITIYAPAIILSSILGWNLNITNLVVGSIVVLYTFLGGTKAVNVTHKLQMGIIMFSLVVLFFILLDYLPDQYSFGETMKIAAANGKLDVVDMNFDWKDKYNIWSCLGALFLFLSYFGTDQSQVQRYLTGKSIRESRMGLIFNGLLKVPLQFFILFLGVLVFVFYQFNKAPIFFNEIGIQKVYESDESLKMNQLDELYKANFESRLELNRSFIQAHRDNDRSTIRNAKAEYLRLQTDENRLREEAKTLIKSVDPTMEVNDKDYVFINFILGYLPKGLIGLLIAVMLCAAMSSTAAELNALASTTTVDIYKRSINKNGSSEHYVNATKFAVLLWGVVAISFASFGTLFENLIQFVNIIGSIFYGTILGIFLVAFFFKRIGGQAVFLGAILAEALVIAVFMWDGIGYLWLNLIGAIAVIIFGSILQIIFKGDAKALVTE